MKTGKASEEHQRHRLLALYLAHEAWTRGVNCVVVTQAQLKTHLGYKRERDGWLDRFENDVRAEFPHISWTTRSDNTTITHLILSRKPIPEDFDEVTMTIDERILGFNRLGLVCSPINLPSRAEVESLT